jgi:hypothetical protein
VRPLNLNLPVGSALDCVGLYLVYATVINLKKLSVARSFS